MSTTKKDDWFVANAGDNNLGAGYEAKALKDHPYYVRVKSLHLLRKVRELFTDTHQLVCMDLGCGTCETTEYFQDEFKHTYACDTSQGMLEHAARKKLRNVTIRHCKSERLPFENETIDVVTMYGIIHHIDSEEKISQTFREVFRVLKHNGIVAVYDFNPLNPVSRHIVKTCPIDEGVHLDGFKEGKFPTTIFPRELIEILRETGFHVVKKEYILYLPKWLSFLAPAERLLSRIPMGGMYAIIGIKIVGTAP